MRWRAYTSSVASIPTLANGQINTVGYGFFPNGSVTIQTMTTSGSASTASQNTLPESPQFPALNLISDGTNIYGQYVSNYPRTWWYEWTIPGLVYSTPGPVGSIFRLGGYVSLGGSSAIVVGRDNANHPAVQSLTLPSTSVNYNNFPGYTGTLGYPVYDGTSVWVVLTGTANLFQIDPSTLSATVHTMPTTLSSPYQIATDGTYVYISADSGGIIVWDIGGASGSVVGSTVTEHCWYSANFGLVFTADTASGNNIYTMPTGGGSLTNIGNADTITGGTAMTVEGFCDGPTNDLWASVSGSAEWNIVYTPRGMKIVGII